MESFTKGEIAAFYSALMPALRQTRSQEWREPCPVHKGERPSFAVDAESGRAFCHSACDKGWDLIGLHQALTGEPFKKAQAEVFRIVGRPDSNGKPAAYQKVAEYAYTNTAGKTEFVIERRRLADGNKDFKIRTPGPAGGWIWKKPLIADSLPYRLHKLASANTIFAVEGEKCVDALEAWGLAATTNAFGAKKWKQGHAEHLRGKHVIILADNDRDGKTHGEIVCQSLAGVAASVRVVNLPGLPEKGDIVDWKQSGGTVEQLHAIVQATAPQPTSAPGPEGANCPEPQPSRIAPGFLVNEHGVFKVVDGDEPKWLCAPLHVVAYARTVEKDQWGKVLRFRDPENFPHQWVMPLSFLAKDTAEFRGELFSLGLKMSAARGAPELLRQYLQGTEPAAFALTVNRIGWSGDTFVLPDENIGPQGGEMILFQPPREMGHYLRTLGTLEEWRENVGRKCSKNRLLLFSVACAAAAPLLPFVGEQSGGFHLVADTTVGKTTCLMVAGSFWGGGGQNGFIQSWLTTANAMENVAEWHNNLLLCLDELKLIDPEQASKVAYSLANGQSKGRMGRDTHAHRRVEWQLLFLSSGEIGLQSHLQITPQTRLYGGQEVRFCEIPARVDESGGAFEFLHGFDSAKAFSEHLKAASRTYYGSACREYLRRLARLGYDQVRSAVQQHQKAFADRFIPGTVPPDVARVGVRFSLVAAGGELITAFGITGWQPGEAQGAAGACFEAWRAQRGGGAWDETQALRSIKSALVAHGNSRFQPFGEGQWDGIKIPNRLGFRTRNKEGDCEYLILPDMFREICGAYPEDLMRRALQKHGFLKGSDARHATVQRTLPELGRTRCYVISSAIFRDEDENGPAE
jgi:uncharacterized protein (DUF927 family)